MSLRWERRRILIWGKTRPEVSTKYREIVCTGGVFEDTRRLVRLYPIPLRYMDGARSFRKYQWITAEVARSPSDPRPESYRIRYDGIEVGDVIPTRANGNWDERAAWVLQPDNVVASVEELKERHAREGLSLALVPPAEVLEVRAIQVARADQDAFLQRYAERVAQMELPLDPETGREVRPLRPPEYRFQVRFRCADSRCAGHEFGILDWDVDALYFRLRTHREYRAAQAAQAVVEKLEETCGPANALHLFLGNIANHPQVFTIVGLWFPHKKEVPPQQRLF